MTKAADRKTRDSYVDIIKGLAISLVLLGHAIQCGSGSAFYQGALFYEEPIVRVIYSVHMPLFMLVSGYLFFWSHSRHFTKDLIRSRFTSLIVPVVAFSVIPVLMGLQGLLSLGFFGFTVGVFRIILGNLWYLWAVFWCSIIVVVVEELPKTLKIGSYILLFVAIFVTPDHLGFHMYKFMFPYFVSGFYFAKNGLSIRCDRGGVLFALLCAVVYVFLMLFYDSSTFIYRTGISLIGKELFTQIRIDLLRYSVGFLGSIVILVTTKLVYEKSLNWCGWKGIEFLGKKSLVLYSISGYLFTYLVTMLTSSIGGFFLPVALIESVVVGAVSLIIGWLLEQNIYSRKLFFGGR